MGKEINDRPYILQASLEMASIPTSDAQKINASGFERFYFNSQRKLAKRGGLGDVVTSLAISLRSLGVNVGVALPNWSTLFDKDLAQSVEREASELEQAGVHHWDNHLFLIKDLIFESASNLEDIYGKDKAIQSLIFQREVLNKIIPSCNPSLIQTHDWMTGLIPSLINENIKSLHTVHNTHSFYSTLQDIQDVGIPIQTEKFYKDSPWGHIVDFQMSGIYGSDHIALVSENWLEELIEGKGINGSPKDFCHLVRKKALVGKARGIINAPDPSYMPEIDKSLAVNFSNNNDMYLSKLENKIKFQNNLNLNVDSSSALIVWNNRLDDYQKGPQHLEKALPDLMRNHPNLQFAIIADGPYRDNLKSTISKINENYPGRIIIYPFSDYLERFGYGAADALLNCSKFAPCEMVQLKGPKYGVMPIVRGVGGLVDSVFHIKGEEGNGIVFNDYDSNAIIWGVNQFMEIFNNKPRFKETQKRIKKYADKNFSVEAMARRYINYYEYILDRNNITE